MGSRTQRPLYGLFEIWLANNESSLALGTAREVVALEPFREAGGAERHGS
jgi:hypothetical protein